MVETARFILKIKSMNPPFIHIVTDTLAARINTIIGKSCSVPFLLDMSALEAGGDLATTQFQSWLSEEEQRHLHRFTLAKRRKEWLAGRICAKAALDDYFITYGQGWKLLPWNEVTITNAESGRPYAILAGGERLTGGPDISISHSGDLALALAAKTCCGVDIQKTSEKHIRVKERFSTDREEQLVASKMRKKDPLMPLGLLWAAKEAAKKALSGTDMPGFLDLVLTDIEKIGEEELLFLFKRSPRRDNAPSEVRVASTCYQIYCLGICIL
jgi:4'-phosphopantetheinyl transferase EntD